MRFRPALVSLAVLAPAVFVFWASGARAWTTIKEWEPQPELPAAVYSHSLVAVENNLIVIGGQDSKGKLRAEVLRASISKGGELSKWSQEKPLPHATTGHSAGAAGGNIYVCGGLAEAHGMRQATSLVWRARPSGGRIRSWQEERPLPAALYSQAQAAFGGWVYLIGGMTAGGHSGKLLIGRLAPSGGIAEWREGLALPVPLAKAAALVVGKHLLVAGGVSPGQGKTIAVPTVYAGPIWEDGTIKTWYLATAKLPGAWLGFGRSDATLVYHENSLFCIGGQDALWFAIKNLASAPFNPENGEMGEWGLMNLPDKFPQITQAATYGERVYVVGGQDEGRASASVLAGIFVKGKIDAK